MRAWVRYNVSVANCPLCEVQVPDDFGLIECGGCGAQLLVHIDGRVEYSGAQVREEEVTSSLPEGTQAKELDPFKNPHIGEEVPWPPPDDAIDGATEISRAQVEPTVMKTFAFSQPEQHEELPPVPLAGLEDNLTVVSPHHEPEAAHLPDAAAEFDLGTEAEPAAAPVSAVEPTASAALDMFDDEATVQISPPKDDVTTVMATDSGDLSDIAKFGNSDATSGRDGSLRYNLFVAGIDTSDLRESFREALTDRKLVWDTDSILRSIKNGEVRIPNVPAAKAFIVVSRLRGLPVQVRWEQYAISQT